MESTAHIPRTMAFSYHLALFVKARWLFAAAAVAAVLFSQYVLNLHLAFNGLYTTIVIVLIYNSAFRLYMRKANFHENQCCKTEAGQKGWNQAVRLALIQILFDLFSLFSLLHFSGGLENPFVVFFMLHMVVATILLERTGTVAVGIIITVLIFTLGFTEHYDLLTHYHLDGFYGGFEPFDSWLFVIGISSVISAMNICLAGLVYLMMLEIKRRRDTIIALSTELEDKNSILLKMDERRKQTMAVASHDLKSPIDAVSSYLNMLQAGYLGEMSPKQLDVVEKSINRLKRLREFVCDVLDWQTIERGELQQIMEQVHIRDIVSSVVDDYKDVAVKKNITLEFTFDDNLPMVNASPRRMAQVFDNLISNAVKYTDNGGTVSVSVQLKDSSVSISVKDSGIGLSDDDMSHLFEDFYRSPRVKKNYDGTGLGLSVVKRIVAAHHGTVTAESRLDHGTEFIVSLPVK